MPIRPRRSVLYLPASNARALSAVKSLARRLTREGRIEMGVLAAQRGPRLPRSVPKPLNAAEADAIFYNVEYETPEPWLAARDLGEERPVCSSRGEVGGSVSRGSGKLFRVEHRSVGEVGTKRPNQQPEWELRSINHRRADVFWRAERRPPLARAESHQSETKFDL